MIIKKLLIIVCIVPLLYACGGGSGGGSGGGGAKSVPSGLISITGNNAMDVAGDSAALVIGTPDAADLGETLIVSLESHPLARHFPIIAFAKNQLRWFVEQDIAESLVTSNAVTGVSATVTVDCDNTGKGSVSVAFIDADNSGTVSTGDSFTLTFTNCLENTLQTTLGGAMVLSNLNVTGDPKMPGSAWSISASFSFNALTYSDPSLTESISGGLAFSISTTDSAVFTGTIDVTSLSGQFNGETETLSNISYTFSSDDNTLVYTLATTGGKYGSSLLGGSVSIETITHLSGTDPNNPDTGVMKFVGANNTSITLTALDSINVQLDVDTDGDGATDQTIATTWAALDV